MSKKRNEMREKIKNILSNSYTKQGEFNEDKALNELCVLLGVSGSVFVLQHKETMRIHGCFATTEDAEKYSNNSPNIAIMNLDIA